MFSRICRLTKFIFKRERIEYLNNNKKNIIHKFIYKSFFICIELALVVVFSYISTKLKLNWTYVFCTLYENDLFKKFKLFTWIVECTSHDGCFCLVFLSCSRILGKKTFVVVVVNFNLKICKLNSIQENKINLTANMFNFKLKTVV